PRCLGCRERKTLTVVAMQKHQQRFAVGGGGEILRKIHQVRHVGALPVHFNLSTAHKPMQTRLRGGGSFWLERKLEIIHPETGRWCVVINRTESISRDWTFKL